MNTSEREKYRGLSKLTAEKLVPAGHVYVGMGIEDGLEKVFGRGSIVCFADPGLKWELLRRAGCVESYHYAVTIKQWEEVTGLTYLYEKIEEKKPQTIFHAEHIDGLGAVALAILKKKDIEIYSGDFKSGDYKYLFVNTASKIAAGVAGDVPNEKYIVSAGEFIKVLESLPDKITEVKYSIGLLEVVINKDGVDIGCQHYSLAEIKGLSKIVLEAYDERKIALEGRSVIRLVPQEIAIVCDGNKFNKGDLTLLNEKIEEFNKLNS